MLLISQEDDCREMIAGRKWAKVSCEGKENKHCETGDKPGVLLERIAVNTDGEELLCKGVCLACNGRCPEEWLWTRHLKIAAERKEEYQEKLLASVI